MLDLCESPLPEMQKKRRKIHLRRIQCEGFQRDDGLIDIEGTLMDEKPFPTKLPGRSLDANEAIHLMSICLTIDSQFLIHAVRTQTTHSPYPQCREVTSRYESLIGMRIEPGFTRQVKRMFRGTAGCSHMTELLPSIATTAYQIVWNDPNYPDPKLNEPTGSGPSPIDGCAALRRDGDVVKLYFPHLLNR